MIIHDNDEVDLNKQESFNEAINKLINNIPLQYITNYQEFMKLDFYVDENVLIPRCDTEILVEEIIENYSNNEKKSYKILDLCTGSGAIGISLAKYIKNAEVVCSDISEKAIEVAKKNSKINNIKNIEFLKSNMFENVIDKFDIIVSNPPYIKKEVIKELDKQVQNEPNIALDGGIDGLDFYRIIADNAYKYLNDNGGLFLEIGYDQKEDVINLFKENDRYKNIYSRKDLYGNDRIVVAYAGFKLI